MSRVRQARELPATMRNPFICKMMVKQIRARAADLEKIQAETGEDESDVVLMLKAFAMELQNFADGKIGTHADNL